MTDSYVVVWAAVMIKDGKIEYVWESADVQYYAEVLGYQIIEWREMYV